jgi:hypothetical protein
MRGKIIKHPDMFTKLCMFCFVNIKFHKIYSLRNRHTCVFTRHMILRLSQVKSWTVINICMFPFNKVCITHFSLHSFYTSTFIVHITCLSFL